MLYLSVIPVAMTIIVNRLLDLIICYVTLLCKERRRLFMLSSSM